MRHVQSTGHYLMRLGKTLTCPLVAPSFDRRSVSCGSCPDSIYLTMINRLRRDTEKRPPAVGGVGAGVASPAVTLCLTARDEMSWEDPMAGSQARLVPRPRALDGTLPEAPSPPTIMRQGVNQSPRLLIDSLLRLDSTPLERPMHII
jgi:hypothetical protein